MRGFIDAVPEDYADKLRKLCGPDQKFVVQDSHDITWYLDSEFDPIVVFPPTILQAAFENLTPEELNHFLFDPFFGVFPHEHTEAKIAVMLSLGHINDILAAFPAYKPSQKTLERLQALSAPHDDIMRSFGSATSVGPLEWVGGEAHEVVTSENPSAYLKYTRDIESKLNIA